MSDAGVEERVWAPPRATGPVSGQARWDVSVVVSAMIVVASVGYGGWLTARSIMDGDVSGSLLRFAASSLIGAYYLVLYHTAQRSRRR